MNHKIELEGETINLKKDFSGWRVIYPIRNEDKSINWKNLLLGGSWYNLFKILLVVGIILFIAFSYKHDMANCIKYGQDLAKVYQYPLIN